MGSRVTITPASCRTTNFLVEEDVYFSHVNFCSLVIVILLMTKAPRSWYPPFTSNSFLSRSCSLVSTCSGSLGIQSTGQTSTHCASSYHPTHSVQRSHSITKISSPSEIASLGHSGSQTPQLTQSSLMSRAIKNSLP